MAAKYVPEPEEAEELILDAIRKLTSAKSKQRATSEKICSALLRSHGLEESTTMLQITMMLATNKIENKPKKCFSQFHKIWIAGQHTPPEQS